MSEVTSIVVQSSVSESTFSSSYSSKKVSTSSHSTSSKRSTTYTGSTFTAFEYGSSFQGSFEDSNGSTTDALIGLEDLDEILSGLKPDEINELSIIDPDDSSLPASLRCLYKCDKVPSMSFNRKQLLKELRENAVSVPDKKERVQFVPGTIRGKKFVTKESIFSSSATEDSNTKDGFLNESELEAFLGSNLSEMLAQATMEDLRTLADILGVTYQDSCSATVLKHYPDPEANLSNVDQIIQNLSSIKDINMNNISDTSEEKWKQFFEGIANSKSVETCSLANCGIKDSVVTFIIDCLERNTSLQSLNVDSNAISGENLVKIISATSKNKTLQELRCSNQLNFKFLGHQIESEIASLIKETPQLVKLGITLEFRETLNKTATQLQKNLDKKRQSEGRSQMVMKPMKKLKTRFADESDWLLAKRRETFSSENLSF